MIFLATRWTTHTRLSIDWEHVSQSTWPRYETLERTLTYYLVPVATTAQFAYLPIRYYLHICLYAQFLGFAQTSEVKTQMQLHMQVIVHKSSLPILGWFATLLSGNWSSILTFMHLHFHDIFSQFSYIKVSKLDLIRKWQIMSSTYIKVASVVYLSGFANKRTLF